MLRYVLTLLFISTQYNSLGLPLDKNPPDSRLVTRLTALANTCKNSFLVDQIKSKLQDCDVNVTPPYHNKKIFQCLIFYDINNQLCAAVNSSKLVLNGDHSAKINEKLVTEDFCAVAKKWKYGEMADYPKFKESAEVVFTKSVNLCSKACGSDEVMSDDSSYFCKYYKWGMDILTPIITTSAQPVENSNNPLSSLKPVSTGAETQKGLLVSNAVIDTQTNNATDGNIQQNIEVPSSSTTTKVIPPKPEIENQNQKPISDLQKPVSEGTPGLHPDVSVNKIETQALGNVGVENSDVGSAGAGSAGAGDAVVGGASAGGPGAGNAVSENTVKLSLSQEQQAPANINIKQEETLDYSRDNADADLDDGDDENDFKPQEMDTIQDSKLKADLPNTLLNIDSSQKEFYPNPMGPDGFPEDDDHFFSFFLTVVILVVLLYVLYHNKSKVSKVVLGLIVEGRQSGRRRNSRGHAYRRLDTLEQAMSGNAAAPPSKIIY